MAIGKMPYPDFDDEMQQMVDQLPDQWFSANQGTPYEYGDDEPVGRTQPVDTGNQALTVLLAGGLIYYLFIK